MRYKQIPIENLTVTEDKIRKKLQKEYNLKQQDVDDEFMYAEWNGMLAIAQIVVAPREWGVVNGIVSLFERSE